MREILGDDPDIVFEHGARHIPHRVFVVKRFGKVVICGATSGYNSISTCATSGCVRRRSSGPISPTPIRQTSQQVDGGGQIRPVLCGRCRSKALRRRTR